MSIRLLLVASLILVPPMIKAQNYTFRTLAGSAGYGTADGVGNSARFSGPCGIAVDSAGNVYVVDRGNSTIRKLTPDGLVTTLAGLAAVYGKADGVGNAARFFKPFGVAVDKSGNVYVADSCIDTNIGLTSNNTVRKVTPAGVVTTVAGQAGTFGSTDGTGSAARFSLPTSVAIDSRGSIYVGDVGNNAIRKLTPDGEVRTWVKGGKGLDQPVGIAVDGANNVYVADQGMNTIWKITPDGTITILAGAGISASYGNDDGVGSAARFSGPSGVTVDDSGSVFVADAYNHTIRKIAPDGTVTTLAGTPGASGYADGLGKEARFNHPIGIALDGAGTIYVADTYNNAIRKLTPEGRVSTFAGLSESVGHADGAGSDARFAGPGSVAVDDAGNTFVADGGNNVIRKITPDGVVTTLAGLAGSAGNVDGAGSAARFSNPAGIAVDSLGNLYVSDFGNNTIRKVTPAGVVTTLAGDPTVNHFIGLGGAHADGTGSAAQFHAPEGITIDSSGIIYVADSMNGLIRRVTPAGAVTTLAGQYIYPSGVAVDGLGDVYVADESGMIQMITPAGSVITLAGQWYAYGNLDGKGSAARFGQPWGITVDASGDVYLTDDSSIRKITSSGDVTTIAGSARSPGSADGRVSTARFSKPRGIALDRAGNLYIADTGNNTIRKGILSNQDAQSGPSLQISHGGSQIVITWPISDSDFMLEFTDDLTHWLPSALVPGFSDELTKVIDVMTGSSRYYRLRK